VPSHSTRVDVIVVSFNSRNLIDECVSSLESQSYSRDLVSLIVVDNGSSDGSVDHVRRTYPHVTLVERQRNGGFGAGVNAGIGHGNGEVVVLLNSDARAHPDFISELVSALSSGDRIAAASAKIVLDGTFEPSTVPGAEFVSHDGQAWKRASRGATLLNSTGNQITRSGNGRDRDWLQPVEYPESPPEVFGFSGGAAAIRRTALDDVGTFDERLFMYYEDTDLSWRMRLAGWEIRYASSAIAFHQHAASSDARSPAFRTWNQTNRVLVAIKNGTPSIVARAVSRASVHALKACFADARGGFRVPSRRLERQRQLRTLASIVKRSPQFARDRRRASARARRRVARFALPD